MPIPTPVALRRALATHRGAEDAFRALSVTRQAIYRKADGAHVHPELVAILREHVAATREQRNARGELGKHSVALPPEVVVRLRVHGRRLSRVVRATIAAALRGPLPAPLPADGGVVVTLDLGATWGALGAAAGTEDPQRIAGILRAILASADVPAPSPPLGRADRRPTRFTPALAETRRKVHAMRDVPCVHEKD
jgi:hypothetical protein